MNIYLDSSEFLDLLRLKAIIGFIIALFMNVFALRQPTDYDTLYRKRIRIGLGVLCCTLIVGNIVSAIYGPAPFMKTLYYISTYGTAHPNDAMIQYGITYPIHPSGHSRLIGLPTFEQWYWNHFVSDIIMWITLAIYFFIMKRSSVKWYVKVRKCVGYIMLLNIPNLLDSLHYLDKYELIPFLIYIILTYFLVRIYRWDKKELTPPTEAKYNNKEFETIAPEQAILVVAKESEEKKTHIRKPINWRKLLLILIACFTVSTIVMLVLFDCECRGNILYIPILLYSSIILLALSIIGLGINFIITNKRKQIKNSSANVLTWYINISMIVSSIILPILMIVGIETDDIFDELGAVSLGLFCSVLLVNIPLIFYVSNKIEQEYSFDYLVPQWLKASIKKYLKNMAAMRACVVFLIYPTTYVATLPLGIFVGVYVIPAFSIFYLCIFISWIIEGRNTAIE